MTSCGRDRDKSQQEFCRAHTTLKPWQCALLPLLTCLGYRAVVVAMVTSRTGPLLSHPTLTHSCASSLSPLRLLFLAPAYHVAQLTGVLQLSEAGEGDSHNTQCLVAFSRS